MNTDKTTRLVTKLRAALTALGDRRDQPTPRALEAFDNRQRDLSLTITLIERAVNALEKPTARLAELRGWLTTATAARTTLQAELDQAIDWRRVDGRAGVEAWRGNEELTAALTALSSGVEFIAGRPAVPGRLAALLLDGWHGSIPALEQRIAETEADLNTRRATLARHLAAGARLLTDREPAHA